MTTPSNWILLAVTTSITLVVDPDFRLVNAYNRVFAGLLLTEITSDLRIENFSPRVL